MKIPAHIPNDNIVEKQLKSLVSKFWKISKYPKSNKWRLGYSFPKSHDNIPADNLLIHLNQITGKYNLFGYGMRFKQQKQNNIPYYYISIEIGDFEDLKKFMKNTTDHMETLLLIKIHD